MLLAFSGVAYADTRFSGRAIGLSVTVPPLNTTVTFADTGPLPSQGGELDATVLSVNTAQAQANVLLSVTMGFDQTAQSEAAVADVVLLPGTTNQVTADFIRSDAVATCSGVSGSSELVNLQVVGQTVTISGQPNQTVTIPGVLTLVINEQTSSSSGGTNSITVNAIDLKTVDGIQVIVSSAHADITCAPPTPVTKDFVTGGGFIIHNGAHANFGFNAGLKPGKTTPSGHLTYMDHGTGLKVSGTVTSYGPCDQSTLSVPCNANSRTFKGNLDDGTGFTVTAADNGNPGKGADYFSITVGTYRAEGFLAGGNINLHT